MTVLLICPFCGETPDKIVDATKVMGVHRIVHRCKVIPPFSLEAATPEKVAQKWNTRSAPSSEALQRAREEEREACARIAEEIEASSEWTDTVIGAGIIKRRIRARAAKRQEPTA